MGRSNSKHLVVQFTENLKDCEHNMGQYSVTGITPDCKSGA